MLMRKKDASWMNSSGVSDSLTKSTSSSTRSSSPSVSFGLRGDAAPGLQAGLRPDHVEEIVHFGRGPGRRVVSSLLRLGDDWLICHLTLLR